MTERRRHLVAVATIAWMTAVINGVYYIYKSISPGEALADMGAVALIAATAGGLGLRLLGAQNPPGRTGEIVLAARLLPGMILSWRRAIRPEGKKEFYWALGATLVVSNLIVPRSAATNGVLMLIPILWVFAALDRRGRWGRWAPGHHADLAGWSMVAAYHHSCRQSGASVHIPAPTPPPGGCPCVRPSLAYSGSRARKGTTMSLSVWITA
jgi:hypothetical protein